MFESLAWQALMAYVGAAELVHNHEALRTDLQDFAEYSRALLLRAVRGRVVTLITDRLTHFGRKIWPLLLAWYGDGRVRLGLLDVREVQKSDHATLGDAFAPALLEACQAGAILTAAVTDNAFNLRRLLDPSKPGALQEKTQLTFLRFACVIHTSFLALLDARKDDPEFDHFIELLAMLAELCNKPTTRSCLKQLGCTSKPGLIQDPKWTSLFQFCMWLSSNFAAVRAAAERLGASELDALGNNYSRFIDVIEAFGVYVNAVQGDSATMPFFYDRLLVLLSRLDELAVGNDEKQANHTAVVVRKCLCFRFSTTADGVACMLSYILTPDGHIWMRVRLEPAGYDAVADQSERENLAEALADRAAMRKRIIAFTQEICTSADPAEVGRGFDNFLQLDPVGFWEPGRPAPSRWRDEKDLAAGGRGAFSVGFAYVAAILTQLPCSEAAAERMFSILKWVATKNRLSMESSLLRAIMLVRMNDRCGLLPDPAQ
jgi:hypothetical protein